MGSLEGKAGHAVNPDALENDNKMNMGVIEMTAVLKRLKKDEKGFTLIELLAVIVILGIIAAIAIPVISNIMSKSRDKSDIATAQQIYDAARMYVSTELNGDFTNKTVVIVGGTGETLVSKKYLDVGLRLPSSKAPILGGAVKFGADGTLTEVIISTDNATADAATDHVFTASDLKAGVKATPTPAAGT